LLKEVLFFAKTIQKDSFFMAQIAQVNIEPNGTFQMVPTLGDHLVLLGSVDQLEDKLNRLFTFYKKVWLGSGVNAYQFIDCRFDHQVIALKKGLQPIQFSGDFKLLVGDSTLLMQGPVINTDSIVKASPVLMDSSKIAKANPKNALSKSKMQVKTVKSKPKMNNKPKNNSLIKKNKTAKALMPKKSKSPTKKN
jgi:cell division protein FtsQ